MIAMAYQITGVSIVCSIVCAGADQRKHQSSASLAFVWVVSPHKGPVTRKMFQLDDVIIIVVFNDKESQSYIMIGSIVMIYFENTLTMTNTTVLAKFRFFFNGINLLEVNDG